MMKKNLIKYIVIPKLPFMSYLEVYRLHFTFTPQLLDPASAEEKSARIGVIEAKPN